MSVRPDRPTQQVLLLLVGVTVLLVGLTDRHLAYVRAGFQPFLVTGGAVVVVVALAGLLRDRGRAEGHPGPAVGWLLVAPVAVLLVVAPPALGAFSAARQTPAAAPAGAPPPAGALGPDDPGEDHRTISLLEYSLHVRAPGPTALEGRRVRLVGFVVPRDDGGWDLARFSIACCAADATVLRVQVLGGPEGLSADDWVAVVGTAPVDGDELAVRAETVGPVEAPAQPYE